MPYNFLPFLNIGKITKSHMRAFPPDILSLAPFLKFRKNLKSKIVAYSKHLVFFLNLFMHASLLLLLYSKPTDFADQRRIITPMALSSSDRNRERVE